MSQLVDFSLRLFRPFKTLKKHHVFRATLPTRHPGRGIQSYPYDALKVAVIVQNGFAICPEHPRPKLPVLIVTLIDNPIGLEGHDKEDVSTFGVGCAALRENDPCEPVLPLSFRLTKGTKELLCECPPHRSVFQRHAPQSLLGMLRAGFRAVQRNRRSGEYVVTERCDEPVPSVAHAISGLLRLTCLRVPI